MSGVRVPQRPPFHRLVQWSTAFPEILSYFSELKYRRDNSPDCVDLNGIFNDGINCLLFVQIYLEELCGFYGLPKECDYTGKAILERKDLFRRVLAGDALREGDVFLFGPDNLDDKHKIHPAIFTGEYDEYGCPMLIHATNTSFLHRQNSESGVLTTSLAKMLSFRKYRKLFGIRRLGRENLKP